MTKLQMANRQLQIDESKLAETRRHNKFTEIADVAVTGAKMVGTAVGAAVRAYTSKGKDWKDVVRSGADIAADAVKVKKDVENIQDKDSEAEKERKNHYRNRRKHKKEA